MATTTSNPIDFAALAVGPVAEGGVGLRGALGLGKRAALDALSQHTGKRLLDVRVGFVTEDDIIKHVGISSFVPSGWLHSACAEPCILFFQEVEHADHNTQRSVLQLVRDRALRGWRLHPETLVFVAINDSPEYNIHPGYPTPYSELRLALGVVYDLVPPLPCNRPPEVV
jgi:MoxR-like ATPase